jgi:hypothetical protein
MKDPLQDEDEILRFTVCTINAVWWWINKPEKE